MELLAGFLDVLVRDASASWRFPCASAASPSLRWCCIRIQAGPAAAKASFLIEVSHTPLGMLAVLVAWARWPEVRLPEPDCRIPDRVLPAAMALFGMFLMFYREEPPW